MAHASRSFPKKLYVRCDDDGLFLSYTPEELSDSIHLFDDPNNIVFGCYELVGRSRIRQTMTLEDI